MANYLDETGLSKLWAKIKDVFQLKLVSGTNIKTVNSQSLLGSGNLTVTASVVEKSTTISGSTGKIYLYRYGNVVFCTTNDGYRPQSASMSNGNSFPTSQNIPSGYRPIAQTYVKIANSSTDQRIQVNAGGTMTYYGGSAWSGNGFFTACWITADD